jgi:small subunit ribosomal protein S9
MTTRLPQSAFTGRPDFYQAAHFLDDVWLRCRRSQSPLVGHEACRLFAWHQRPEMARQLGLGSTSLTEHQYGLLIRKLECLRPYSQAIPEVGDLIRRLSPNLAHVLEQKLTSATLGPASLIKRQHARYDARHDVFVGYGFRKTAQAKVCVKEINDGNDDAKDQLPRFQVNDTPVVDYFARIRDRLRIAKVLQAVSTAPSIDAFRSFRVLAEVQGGGLSGQAGAVALGLARALGLQPQRHALLSAKGLLTRDSRIVERKKPGQEKARKKFAWVKR